MILHEHGIKCFKRHKECVMRGLTPAPEAADISRHLRNASRNFLDANRHVEHCMPPSLFTQTGSDGTRCARSPLFLFSTLRSLFLSLHTEWFGFLETIRHFVRCLSFGMGTEAATAHSAAVTLLAQTPLAPGKSLEHF